MTTSAESVRKAFHYLYPNELPFLQELVRSLDLPNPIVVNIGAGAGTSGLAILESRADVTLITIDVTDLSSPLGCLEAERDVVRKAGYGDLWLKRWFQIHARSQHVARDWGQKIFGNSDENAFLVWGDVDMVFVDGDHSYDGCNGDVRGWLRHIRKGGILAVHDFDKQILPDYIDGPHPMSWPGVDLVVKNFLIPNYPLIRRVDSLIAFQVP